MDRNAVPGPEKRDQAAKRPRRPSGLQVIEREGHWHIYGIVNVAGRSRRVRKTTGLAATQANLAFAEEERHRIETEVREQVRDNRGPDHYVAVAAERYINRPRERPVGATTLALMKKVVAQFGMRRLRDIGDDEWANWVDRLQEGNAAETRERFIASVIAFLNWCAARPRCWCVPPIFERNRRARNPRRRSRRRVRELSLELIQFLLAQAAPHLKAQLWTEWSTGARVSSILHGCRLCDLVLAPGREQITFHNTKNGESVDASLHPLAVDALQEYLNWRGNLHDREGPLFLTHKKEPYSKNTIGAQNRSAFNAMKRRACALMKTEAEKTAADLIALGQPEQAAGVIAEAEATAQLLSAVTQHWFRHMLATKMIQIGDIPAAMRQGGWLDERSVMGYQIDVEEHRRAIVNRLHLDTPLAHKR